MTKDIILQMRGTRYDRTQEKAEPEPIEMETLGTYYQKNGKHYVMYEEVMEGFSETTKNIIKIGTDTVDITRRGTANTTMSFEKERKKVSDYHTPFGSMRMGIFAHKVEINESKEQIEVHIHYEMEMNESPVADCDMRICIQPKKG